MSKILNKPDLKRACVAPEDSTCKRDAMLSPEVGDAWDFRGNDKTAVVTKVERGAVTIEYTSAGKKRTSKLARGVRSAWQNWCAAACRYRGCIGTAKAKTPANKAKTKPA